MREIATGDRGAEPASGRPSGLDGGPTGGEAGRDRLDRWLRELESWTESRGAPGGGTAAWREEASGAAGAARNAGERRAEGGDAGPDANAGSGLTRAEVQSLFTWACP